MNKKTLELLLTNYTNINNQLRTPCAEKSKFEQLIKKDAKKWMLRIIKVYKDLIDVDFESFDSTAKTQNTPDIEINFMDFQSAEFNRTYPNSESRKNIGYGSEA